ncbi:hypothetical protein [Streptomyces sp.]|uniref:hypothetical protein n=1 Tax=Streptomyces sp. TaxID=1931 RepID=UPI002811E915|nr:hypothetical protein [Streptomyces sp.]
MNRRTLWSSVCATVLALTALTGCDLSAEEVEQGADNVQQEVEQGAEEVQQGAEEGLQQVEQGVEDAQGGDGGDGNR